MQRKIYMARIFLISLLLTTSAIAQERSIEPTVTLTSSELQAIVAAELARAQAASAMQKVQAAFAPKAPTPKIDEKK
jgi:hypothetical protein